MDAALGPPKKMADRREDLTPMMRQYFELTEEYDDALVLFQVGDFYEAFCEAAETVARLCEITLTKREDSTGQYAMAGIPIDNAESYIERLLDAGYRVAVADQVQDPEETTGVVDRAVTRIVTPGTLTEAELLDGEDNNYVAAVAKAQEYGLALLDVSTGDFYATSAADRSTITDELNRFDPAEAIVGPDAPADLLSDGPVVTTHEDGAFESDRARETLRSYFGAPESLLGGESEIKACGALLDYAEYARGGEDGRLDYLNHLTRYDPREYMLLDAVALESLELFEPRAVHGRGGLTLVDVLDETACALGRRTLTDWLRRPLIERERIAARHDAVDELVEAVQTREGLHDDLRDVYDIERLISRVARGRANARDLRSLKDTLDIVPHLRATLSDPDSEKLRSLRDRLDQMGDIRSLIAEAIQEEPDREITEGGVIKPSYDEELARLRETERDGKAWIDELEAKERERTGIESLKVGQNAVHGYYIEVTDANLDRVPDDYERRQTLKNAERYYTPELKDREDEIFRAENRADELEYDLFTDVRSSVADESERVQALADALAELDVLVSFATVAAEYGYTRPEVATPGTGEQHSASPGPSIDGIHIENGRHPVVERTQSAFVPNDAHLDSEDYFAIVTGPNMSGKSTYMRQVALIVILAQMGCFVPASEARIELVDRVFTRVGASDDIAGGRSTFMVEMTELSDILDHATEQSLVLLDEVGRGTSTTDGLAIARAVTEYIHDKIGARTLFATHHHDLTEVTSHLDGAFNLHFRTRHEDGDVIFEHAVDHGAAAASYGVDVAGTAGIPPAVVERARDLLADGIQDSSTNGHGSDSSIDQFRESEPPNRSDNGSGGRGDDSMTVDGDSEPLSTVARRLETVDVATMTPLDALNTLAELKEFLE
jgi:DNA mismatch repair protein MutS